MLDFTDVLSDNGNVIITVKTIGNPLSHPPQSVRLNLTDNLLIIRQELNESRVINDTLLFSRRYLENNYNDNNNYEFAEIPLEKEEDFSLTDIICESGDYYILYLKQSSKVNWSILNNLRNLDYGCTMTFDGIDKAKKRAFEMKDCVLTEIDAEGCRRGSVEFKSKNDWMMKTNLFFRTTGANVLKFAELGISDNTKYEEINKSYHFTKYSKVSLQFDSENLKPTPEFIGAVNDAIESKDSRNFKSITEKFGQFIPTEVTFGGRVHFIDLGKSANMEVLGGKVAKLIGGKQPNSLENFEEKAWVKSLNDYKNWDCIEFKNPISIFQLLPDELRKKIIRSVGKRIHFSKFEDFNYRLEESGRPIIFELKNIPLDVLKVIQNEDADCKVFASVIDTTESKNDFFTCQVLWPYKKPSKPSLIIHCFQKKFKKREYKLKIRWMVIGYYTDFSFVFSDFDSTQLKIMKKDFNTLNNSTMINTELLSFEYNSFVRNVLLGIPVLGELNNSNSSLVIGHHFFNSQEGNKIGLCTFSYCLKNNQYVNLPGFTFYALIILNYPIPNAYDTIPFNYSPIRNPYVDVTGNPKFISLYSTQGSNCGPIFLKQKARQIKVKSINCRDRTCFICTNTTFKVTSKKNNLKCALFDPSIVRYSYLFC